MHSNDKETVNTTRSIIYSYFVKLFRWFPDFDILQVVETYP